MERCAAVCVRRAFSVLQFLSLPSVYASDGCPGMPYARQNGEKCGLALVRQGKNQKKPNILAMFGL
ncbi:MAG: hypothetical protein EGP94_08510 [Lachnospiraceae bacterium]|nr:hypothetical protein [Lachnospiraceae bacterium]